MANRTVHTALLASVLALVVATVDVDVFAASAPGSTTAPECATVHVAATPRVNAQNAPFETIYNRVTNCGSTVETVVLSQRIHGPSARDAAMGHMWTIRLYPGQIAHRVQHIPYACCGTYTVIDTVSSTSGRVLASASTQFTFA